MSALSVEHTYRYLAPSSFVSGARPQLLLSTAGVDAAHPYFFKGVLTRPHLVARMLRSLMDVVQARFHTPAAMVARALALADPVVTCSESRLRFEAFSGCASVYVRVDLDPGAAEGERPGSDRRDAATALVEQGQRFRQALAGVLAALETESLESGQRARALRARLRDREIQGREIRVIHDPGRLDDARRVVELLSRAGARAVLVASEVESPSRNKGRLFYHGEQARDAARAIADLVGEIEYLQPEAVGLAQPFVSLWIVSDGLQSERLSGS